MTFRSVPWTSQPQDAVCVIPEFSQGIVFLPSIRANCVNGKKPVASGTGLFSGVNVGGEVAGLDGTGTGRYDFTVTDSPFYTVVWYGSILGSGTSTIGRIFSTLNGSGGHELYCSGGNLLFDTWFSAGSGQGTFPVSFSEKPICIVATYDASNGTNRPDVWVEGKKITLSGGTSSGSRLAGGTTLAFGGRASSTDHQGYQKILLAGYVARKISGDLAQSLSANPYQIFQPRKLPIFVDIPVDHNIYAYTDESATTNETSEYPSTGSVFNEGSQDINSSAESSSVLVNLNAASIEPSTSQESSTSQTALQAARVEFNASQESSTSQATLQSVLTESNASQDTQTQGATSSNTTTDTNSVTDSSIKVYTAQTTLNDTNSVVDNQTAQAQLYAARSEVNNAVESISALAQLYAAKTESFAATETSTQGASSSNNTTDSIGVTDSSTKAYIAQATLSDSNTSTDGSTVQAQFYAAKTEVATTLDSLLVQASLLAVKLETASPTDSRTTSSTFAAAQLNTINIIDTYAAIASLTAQLHTISNSIEVLLSNSISSANTLEITTALDDFYALLEQLIYQLSQVVFMNETLAFTLIPISRTTSLRAETNAPLDVPASSNNEYTRDPQAALRPSEARNTTFNSSIRLTQFLATKPITTYIRT